MRGLWELESDPELKAAYANGLRASDAVAAERLRIAQQFDNDDQRKCLLDWRELNKRWRKQASAEEAYTLGHEHLLLSDKLSPRRVYEYQFVSEPVFAAFVVSLCPDSTVLRKHAQRFSM